MLCLIRISKFPQCDILLIVIRSIGRTLDQCRRRIVFIQRVVAQVVLAVNQSAATCHNEVACTIVHDRPYQLIALQGRLRQRHLSNNGRMGANCIGRNSYGQCVDQSTGLILCFRFHRYLITSAGCDFKDR